MKLLKVALAFLLVLGLIISSMQAFAEVVPKSKSKPAAKSSTAASAARTDTTSAKKTTPSNQPTGSVPDKIQWVSFDKGVQLQKGTDKHLFVDFTTTWCGWCKKMEAETFSDTAVAHYINRNFVPVKVWGDQDSLLDIDGYKITQKQLTQSEFQVTGFPTFWFVNTKKQKLGPLPGYMTKQQLMNILPVVAEYRYDSTRTQQGSTTPANNQGK